MATSPSERPDQVHLTYGVFSPHSQAERDVGRKGRELTGQEVSATLAAICEPRGPRALAAVA
jgi:hypothetical protein